MSLKGFLAIACLVLATTVHAQVNKFKFKADIQKVDSGGFYQIKLDRNLIAKSCDSLKDIRLMNDKGRSIAYVLSSTLKGEIPQSFIAFRQVHTATRTDTGTVYVGLNAEKLNISRLWIKLKNTAVDRSINLYGSDDLVKWFAIKEGIALQEAGNGNLPEYEQSLSFPASDYRYFKVLVNDKNKAPVKILRTGIYVTNYFYPEEEELPPVKLKVSDSNRVSRIDIALDQRYLVGRLHFDIARPKFFSRKAMLFDRDSKSHEPGWEITLNSSDSTDIYLSGRKSRHFELTIDNADDNPLEIKSVTAYQHKEYLFAYLEGGHSYYLLTANPVAKNVKYDLSFLQHLPANVLPTLKHSGIYPNPAYAVKGPAIVKHNLTQLIWIAIVVVLMILSLLTWRMVKELNAKNTGNTDS